MGFASMKVSTFALERWMSRWETEVEFDIAESGVYPLTTRDVLNLLPEAARAGALDALLDLRLGYTEARGTKALRETLAAVYEDTTADNILVTTGAIEANYLLFNSLLDPGDHVVAVYPAYQQLYAVAEAIGCDVSAGSCGRRMISATTSTSCAPRPGRHEDDRRQHAAQPDRRDPQPGAAGRDLRSGRLGRRMAAE